MKAATAVLFAVACATSTANGANLRSSAGVGEVARLMGRNTMYTGVVDMLRKEAPATAILKKLDSMKAVLKDRRAQVTEGCAIDNRHVEGDYEIAKGNVTEVSALVESKKMCVEHSTKKENEASEILAKTLKGLGGSTGAALVSGTVENKSGSALFRPSADSGRPQVLQSRNAEGPRKND